MIHSTKFKKILIQIEQNFVKSLDMFPDDQQETKD